MAFVRVSDLHCSGCGGQKQLPAVLQLAVEPGQAIVVVFDVVVYVVYIHACSFFGVLAYASSNFVEQAGRCFNGGVNGGGFDSQNWILTEVQPQATRERAPVHIVLECITCVQDSPLSGAEAEAIVYVAVVDAVGVWVYRIPAEGISSWCYSSVFVTHACPDIETIWPGLSRRVASAEVQVRFHPVARCICAGVTPLSSHHRLSRQSFLAV